MSTGFERLVVSAQPKVLGGQIGIDYFVRIHPVIRIPHGLELTKRVDQFRSEHLGKQGSAGLPVAMFTGKRAAITHHEISGSIYKLRVFANAIFAEEIKRDPHMDAAVPEMPIESSAIFVFVEQS